MSGVSKKVTDITPAHHARCLEPQRARRASEKAARPPTPTPEQNCARARKAAETKRAKAAAATDTRTADSRARGAAPGPSISPWRGRAKDKPKPVVPMATRGLSARVLVLDRDGHVLAEVKGIEDAMRAAKALPDAMCIIGLDAEVGRATTLARCSHGMTTPSEFVCSTAVRAWRERQTAAQHLPASLGAPDGLGRV